MSASAAAQDTPAATPEARRIDAILTAQAAKGFSGNVMLVEGGKVAIAKGYGLANRADQRPFTAATVVQIGSNTKDFTAIAILQLVNAGKLSLDDSLASIWRDVPPTKRGITVRMLLSHRAGLAQYGGDDFAAVTRPQMVDAMLDTPLRFAPGTKDAYSNVGYSVLAAIIELKSGVSYDEFIATNILTPIGVKETGFLLPRFPETRLAHGYRRDGTDNGTMISKPHAADGSYWNLRGNGGMLSTLDDMRRFYDAVYADALVSGPLRKQFFPDEAVDLAGSDGVSFFFFEREPASKRVLFLSSTNEAVPGGAVLRAIHGASEPGPTTAMTGKPQAPDSTVRKDFPDTRQGQTARNWLDAFNSGSTSDLQHAIALSVPVAGDARTAKEKIESLATRRQAMGRLTVREVRAENPDLLRVVAQPENGEQLTLVFEFSPADPQHIKVMRMLRE